MKEIFKQFKELGQQLLYPDPKNKQVLYACPTCGEPVFEGDYLYAIDHTVYCAKECQRPLLMDTKSYNMFQAESSAMFEKTLKELVY